MAVTVRFSEGPARMTHYLADLRCSPEWDGFIRELWEAATAAQHVVAVLDDLRGKRGMMRNMMLERLIDHQTQVWQEIEAYARPLVEGLAQ